MKLKFFIITTVVAIIGFFAGRCSMPEVHVERAQLNEQPVLVNKLLELGDRPIRVEEGCMPNQEPYLVEHFLTNYIAFLNDPDTPTRAGQVACGMIDDNICELYYARDNIEDDMGMSQNLRFEVDPETNEIVANSFECWGM